MLDDVTSENALKRLKSIGGQVEGVVRMVEQRKYCMDIVHQITAVRKALDSVALVIMDRHVKSCVREAYSDGNEASADRKVDELFEEMNKFLR